MFGLSLWASLLREKKFGSKKEFFSRSFTLNLSERSPTLLIKMKHTDNAMSPFFAIFHCRSCAIWVHHHHHVWMSRQTDFNCRAESSGGWATARCAIKSCCTAHWAQHQQVYGTVKSLNDGQFIISNKITFNKRELAPTHTHGDFCTFIS